MYENATSSKNIEIMQTLFFFGLTKFMGCAKTGVTFIATRKEM